MLISETLLLGHHKEWFLGFSSNNAEDDFLGDKEDFEELLITTRKIFD